MMLRKLVGYLLIIAAVAGLIFCLVGLIEMWRFRPLVTKAVADNLALVDQALNTTQDGLTIVGQMVQTTADDVASLQTTIQALAMAIHDTHPMLDSLIGLTSHDFPAAIDSTQTSLTSAQSSALLIDNVLSGLTSFLPVLAYKPAVPLHTALAKVSTSLDTLVPSLATIKTSLEDGKTNLGALEVELNKISETTQGISLALGSAQSVIDQYQAVTMQLRDRLEAFQPAVTTWITVITLILSFLLIWLLIAQLGLGMQGLNLLKESHATQ